MMDLGLAALAMASRFSYVDTGATCMICAVDSQLGASPEILALLAKIQAEASPTLAWPPRALFAEASEHSRWVLLCGIFLEPSAWSHWSVAGHDDLDEAVRGAVARHLEIAITCGVDVHRALGFTIAPFSHGYERVRDALSRYQESLRQRPPDLPAEFPFPDRHELS